MKYLNIDNKCYGLINKETKKGQELIKQYYQSYGYALRHCYNRPSKGKQNIEQEIEHGMHAHGCGGYKILTYCIMNFKCGYLYEKENKKYLLVETHKHNYAIEL